jgi:aryl-alcohol dehydrogenase-like predicted oxidoreductase
MPTTSEDSPQRWLGATGLTVSRLGLGLAALGRPAYINVGRAHDFGPERSVASLEARCHRMLDAAYALGIRYIDTARSYGRAEAFLAAWLEARQLPPDAVTVGSKWGYAYVGSWQMSADVHEVKDLSLQNLRRQIAESRELLGKRLSLYQIHSATLESGVLDNLEVLDELNRLRADGLVVGLTVSGPRQADVIRRALRVSVNGANPFQVVQATWNLLEPSAGAALADAKAQGWGVIVKEALANGRLTERNSEETLSVVHRRARAHEVGPDAYALAAALAQPWADVVLSGAVTDEQLRSNLDALSLSNDAGDWPSIAEPSDEYWKTRSQLPWS